MWELVGVEQYDIKIVYITENNVDISSFEYVTSIAVTNRPIKEE